MVAVAKETGCYLCYLLASSTHGRKTYVGVTNDFPRRLRQHNGLIKGGAKATRVGRPWNPLLTVEGFPTYKSSLQFEWMWKHMAPKKSHGKRARLTKLNALLQKEKWTEQAPLASSIPLVVRIWPSHDNAEEEADEDLKLAIEVLMTKGIPDHVQIQIGHDEEDGESEEDESDEGNSTTSGEPS